MKRHQFISSTDSIRIKTRQRARIPRASRTKGHKPLTTNLLDYANLDVRDSRNPQ